MEKKFFGKLENGTEIYSYVLSNGKMKAEILNLGGTVRVLECDGVDVVGGYDTLEGILTDTTYQGALIGRYGNRIKNAQFTLNGVTYTLYANNHENHLHGGKEGFNRKVWEVKSYDDTKIVLAYTSADGEEGYPGKLNVTVTYTLYADAIRIDYDAVSDRDTYCNLTNHAYFNLDGVGAGQITDHTLKINATTYTAVGAGLIPTGEHPTLDGSPYDFREPKKIGRDLVGKVPTDDLYGYDHNFILDTNYKEEYDGKQYNFAAELTGKKLSMKVLTTKPCMQVYTGAFLEDDGNDFKGGVKKFSRMAVALETQYEPDSPTRVENVLHAGEKYEHSTVYKFNI
ncbi:MAG: aldose epimerase family protein [Clostridia bacterium]|nr:aldose epimerase family protein [Clostridia bacterium]